ncbi:unnamed protein product [Caenorhabditis sp. 36 PRJEB53466]|nr:unnamed protein product [Caenorhabditis sp. 36 PRJEB53466]
MAEPPPQVDSSFDPSDPLERLRLRDDPEGKEDDFDNKSVSSAQYSQASEATTAVKQQPFLHQTMTKVYCHIDDEPDPYMMEVHVPPDLITLGDLKRILMRTNFKYYRKALDPDSGYEVKAEIRDDSQRLTPSPNNLFELFLLTIEGSTHSDGSSGKMRKYPSVPGPAPSNRNGPPLNYQHAAYQFDNSMMSTDSESMISAAIPAYLKNAYNRRFPQQYLALSVDAMSNCGAHASGSGRSSDVIRSFRFTTKERKVLSNYTAPPPNRHQSPGVVSQLVNKIEQKASPPSTTSRRKKKSVAAPPLAQMDDLEILDDSTVEEVVKTPRRKKYSGNPLGNLKMLTALLPGSSKDSSLKTVENKENQVNQPSTGKKLKKSKSKSRVEPETEPQKFLRLKRTLTDSTNNHTPTSSTWRQMVSSALGGPLKKRLSEGALFPGTSTDSAASGGATSRRLQRKKSAGGEKEPGGSGSASSSFFGALIRLSNSAASLTSLTSLGSASGSKSNTRGLKKKEPPPPALVTQAPSVSVPAPTFPPAPTVLTPSPLRKSKTCQVTPDRPPIIPSITITESRSLNRIDRCRPVTVDGSGLTADRRHFVSRRSTMSRTMSLIPTSPSLPPLYEEETASTAALVEEERADKDQRRRMRRYGGSNTTSTYQGRKDVAPDASPRRHLIGFLHRTSHLSLTSELSGDASFYLIGHRRHLEESTIGSESDARVFSDDDDRGSTTTDFTSVSRQHEKMAKKKKNKRNFRKPSRASSFSSITESSMSLDVITVNLNMDTVNFLGISIVGQTSTCGDNGIFVANIMKGGAVALDGRIEAGDMLLQVNDVSFENFTNDQAVDVLREAVSRRGPIKLTVAKSFENGQSCFTIPRNSREEPVRPIDTQAWIQHTNAMRGMPSIVEESAPTPIPGEWPHGRPPSSSTVTSNGSNGQNTIVGNGPHIHMDVHTDKKKVVEMMAMPGSGLDIKNRTWLKIPIPMSFLGSDLVEWLLDHVEGLRERKTARNYAAELLKLKYIAHVVNKVTFTEQCYYVLGDECADYARFRNEDGGPKYQWTIGINGMSANGGSVMLPPPHLPGPSGAFKGTSMVSDGESRILVFVCPGKSKKSMKNGIGIRCPVSGYASMPSSPFPMQMHLQQQQRREGSTTSGSSGGGIRRRVLLPNRPSADSSTLEGPFSRQSFRAAMGAEQYECFLEDL